MKKTCRIVGCEERVTNPNHAICHDHFTDYLWANYKKGDAIEWSKKQDWKY